MEQAATPEAIEEELPKEDQQAGQHCLRGHAKMIFGGTVIAVILIIVAVIAARFGRVIIAIVLMVFVIITVVVMVAVFVYPTRSGRQSTVGAIQ